MAKTVRQQLSDLVAGKKPNLFYKGLNTDTDEHIINNSQYSSAMNVRLNAKDGDLGTIQNLQSNHVAGNIGLVGYKFSHTETADKLWVFGSGTPLNQTLFKITFKFGTTGGFHSFNGSDGYDVDTTSGTFSQGSFQYDTSYYSNQDLLLHCFEVMRNDSAFTDVMSVSLHPASTKYGPVSLIFIPVDQSLTPNSVGITTYLSTTLALGLDGGTATSISTSIDTWNAYYYSQTVPLLLQPVSLTSFSSYIAAVCYISEYVQAVVKIFVTETGEISSVSPVVFADFSISNNYQAIKVEKIEENQNYNRIYWTNGIHPIKTVNLNSNSTFYNNFDSPDDFNLFSNSPLNPPEIVSVTDSGAVKCGSWSYCYRLITSDGKYSVVSPITNPLPLLLSSKSSSYESAIGGNVSENSGKSIFLRANDIDTVYSRIQLIGIQYLDNHGGAAFFLLKDEKIDSSTVNLTHTGNEITTPITAAEILSKSNTWDIAQDITVKDNRLLAANLQNTSSSLIEDNNTFRVKSWKHTAAAADFDTAPGSGAYQSHTELNNPEIYEEDLYKLVATDTNDHRYAYAGTGNTEKMLFGASTEGYEVSDSNGVYVTFKLKKFTLDKADYWSKIATDDPEYPQNSNDDGYCEPPFYGPLSKSGEDGYFDNYKNPVFAQKHVGYMRDEIYRFGIQLFDKEGNQTYTYPVGDVRFPPIESDYRVLGTTPGDYTPIAGGEVNPLKYVLCDNNGDGYILYPEFRVKLSNAVVKNISGFNIVRAVRNDTDKRVITTGLLNNTLSYKNATGNGHFKNRLGLDKQNLFTQVTGSAAFGDSEQSSLVTLDSPDAMFGVFNYTSNQSHQIKIASKLLNKSYLNTDKPTGSTDNHLHMDNSGDEVTWMRDNNTNSIFYAAPFASDYTVPPNNLHLEQLSMFSKYYSADVEDHALTLSGNSSYYIKNIHYGQLVGAGEIVPSSLTTETKDFVNAAWIYSSSDSDQTLDSHDLNAISLSSSLIYRESGKTQHGNATILIAMDSNEVFDMDHANLDIASSAIRVEGGSYAAAKGYAKIINPITVASGQYGGSTVTNFENTRWISTGASVHGSELSSESEMIVPVFGGDTYVNMFSLNKFHKNSYGENTTYRITQGVVFPVESSINIDLREGGYFGKDRPNLNKEDDYTYNKSYSASNNLKSFPSKDSDIDLVTDFKNMVAVSNVKVAGQTQDAFSRFDANEIFEVNANYGAINNLALFRNNVYAIQENATSILSINTRALINSKDGSAISIQSALGTGSVIERNDYISTKYGSQNRINSTSTDLGLYWYDGNNNTICEVDVKSPQQVADISSIKGCSSLLSSIENVKIYDNPLNVSTSTGSEGGINIAYNPIYNELLFSISHYSSGMVYKTIAYDEALGVFTSERSYSTFISTYHKGILYTVGTDNGTNVTSNHVNRKTIYSHDTLSATYNTFYGIAGDNPFVEFTNNEETVSLKVYDKLVVNNNGTSDSRIFSTFAYSTNNDALSSLDLSVTEIDRMGVGKHIIPIHKDTGRFKGNYLKVKMTQSENPTTQGFNLFSVVSHYRKNII